MIKFGMIRTNVLSPFGSPGEWTYCSLHKYKSLGVILVSRIFIFVHSIKPCHETKCPAIDFTLSVSIQFTHIYI